MSRVVIEIDRDGLTGGLQANISELDEVGYGHGYRLLGPKYSGTGTNLARKVIDQRAAREILRYIAPLVGVDEYERESVEFS